jgi:pantetheine-phosphate adenylyltransferase
LTIAIYPGRFDPITNGHIDVARRAAKLFDKLVFAVYKTPGKPTLFNLEERLDMAQRALVNLPNVEVQAFDGLAVDFAQQVKAKAMVRGLRVSADFEREFDMAMMNKKLQPDLELVCFMASPDYQFLRSSLLKEVAKLGGNIKNFVPDHVAQALRKKEGV